MAQLANSEHIRLRNYAKSILIALFLMSLFGIFPARAQEESEISALRTIVMITSSWDRQKEIGSGILVGEDPSSIYVVTARHVVTNQNSLPDPKISIQFYSTDNDVNYSTNSVTILPLSWPGVDLAVLKIEKNSLPPINMPTIEHQFYSENPPKVRFVGRKNARQVWRQTPLSKGVKPAQNLTIDDRMFFAGSLFSLEAFSGGGVFDENWKLVGMTVNGGNQLGGFGSEGIVAALKLQVIVEILKNSAIPIAPYLQEYSIGPVPENLNQYTIATNFHFGTSRLGYEVSFYSYSRGRVARQTEYILYVKFDGEWHIWDKFSSKTNSGGISIDEFQYTFPYRTEEISLCQQNSLPNGATAFHVQTVTELPTVENYYEIYQEDKAIYSADTRSCEKALASATNLLPPFKISPLTRQIRTLKASSGAMSTLFHDLKYRENGVDFQRLLENSTIAPETQPQVSPSLVLFGTGNFDDNEQLKSRRPSSPNQEDSQILIVSFSGGENLASMENFKIYVNLILESGRIQTILGTQNHLVDGVLEYNLDRALAERVVYVSSVCMIGAFSDNYLVSLKQNYWEGERPLVQGTDSIKREKAEFAAQYNLKNWKVFYPREHASGFESNWGKTASDACGSYEMQTINFDVQDTN